MKMDHIVKVGDVFQFGGPSLGWACGQIVLSGTLQYVVIFEPVFAEEVDLAEVTGSPILLAGWTMDARIQSGAWRILGNANVSSRLKLPEYHVEIDGHYWVTDVEGRTLRRATASELVPLRRKSSHSPIAYEKAYWAFHNGTWESRFDALKV